MFVLTCSFYLNLFISLLNWRREPGHERGGVALYVHEDINGKVIEFQIKIEFLIIQANSDTKTRETFALFTDHIV